MVVRVALGVAVIAIDRTSEIDVAMHRAGIRIEQELGRVVAKALLRPVRAVDAEAIGLPWRQTWQIAVPNVTGAFRQGDALGLKGIVWPREEA
jgi:hypothetical protein